MFILQFLCSLVKLWFDNSVALFRSGVPYLGATKKLAELFPNRVRYVLI